MPGMIRQIWVAAFVFLVAPASLARAQDTQRFDRVAGIQADAASAFFKRLRATVGTNDPPVPVR